MTQALRIHVELWGVAVRLAGAQHLTLELPAGATVATAAEHLAAVGGLAAELPRCAFALGDDVVRRDHALRDGDVLGVLPPVAGG